MTVDELLASKDLTPEEWEMHRELIEDCRRNEALIAQNQSVTKENIEKSKDVFEL